MIFKLIPVQSINLINSINGIMKFELISKNHTTYNNLCDRVLFNPAIQSVIFDDGFKIQVYVDKSKLADFALMIKDLDVGITEDTSITRLK